MVDYHGCAAFLAAKQSFAPFMWWALGKEGNPRMDGFRQNRYERTMKMNKITTNEDTNVDILSHVEMMKEARVSKNRARVNLLYEIHSQLEEERSMDTAYGYDPENDMSFTGEFEAIGA